MTLNAAVRSIITHDASLAAAADVTFTVTNDKIAATDVVVSVKSGAGTGLYLIFVQANSIAAGSFDDHGCKRVRRFTAGETVVMNFVVIKAAASLMAMHAFRRMREREAAAKAAASPPNADKKTSTVKPDGSNNRRNSGRRKRQQLHNAD